ncbi:MAG: glycosyltransferase [Pyrinomonadaceae bacterium]
MRTLYICYFGLREPLVQTQVLPYLRQLGEAGIEVSLLTFEPNLKESWPREEADAWRARLRADGIRWLSLAYHKRPSVPATAYDILTGARLAARLVRREGIEVLHARSHVPLAMALLAQRWTGCRLVFDIRGLMAEEYVDAGVWTDDSPPFRAIKRIERAGIRRADQLVVLTRRMRDWLVRQGLKSAGDIEVIPCCVDFSRFDEAEEGEATKPSTDRFEVVYAGSVTGLYMLEEMGRFFLELKKEQAGALLRIMTTSSPTDAANTLTRIGLEAEDFWVGAAQPAEVPSILRRARLGLSFRKRTFSQIAASPTKIPEYLAAGLPVVCNAGIGDTDDLLVSERVGVVVENLEAEAYREAARAALELSRDAGIRTRSIAAARRHFDLREVGGAGYLSVYRRIEESNKEKAVGRKGSMPSSSSEPSARDAR